MLLVVLGPLLLIPITWVLYRFAARPILAALLRPRASESSLRWASLAITAFVVAVTLAGSYFPGKREFDRLCSEHAVPSIADRVEVDGFFRTRMFPYEAKGFLESFSFVEAPDPYREDVTLRYVRDGDDVRRDEVTARQSRYVVRQRFSQLDFGITMTEKYIYELATRRELARAASINYHGGPLSLLLGVYAMSSCPDIRTVDGSRDFMTFYNLETEVLRASGGPSLTP
ncbi:MAG: hypothetical protein GY953_07805 [bacterium]|nr:hypothetical protein [bacterium]